MKNLGLMLLSVFICSCGVRGDPQPPLEAPYIGRGQPTYQKAIQSLKKKKLINDEWKDEEKENENEEEFSEDSP